MDGAPSLTNKPPSKHRNNVLLDTNFLFLPFQHRIDIFEEIPRLIGGHVQFLILPQVLKELKWLETHGTLKERNTAKSALLMLNQHCQMVENLSQELQVLDADNALLRYARESNAIVATNDSELRRKLLKQGSRAIFLRKLAVLAITD